MHVLQSLQEGCSFSYELDYEGTTCSMACAEYDHKNYHGTLQHCLTCPQCWMQSAASRSWLEPLSLSLCNVMSPHFKTELQLICTRQETEVKLDFSTRQSAFKHRQLSSVKCVLFIMENFVKKGYHIRELTTLTHPRLDGWCHQRPLTFYFFISVHVWRPSMPFLGDLISAQRKPSHLDGMVQTLKCKHLEPRK